jgi:site-specific DNA-adenine methylase
LEELQRLDQLQQFINMQRLAEFESIHPIWELSNLSYEDFVIPNNAIVYLDPPYKETENKYGAFDHSKFEQWAKTLKVPAFLSEYQNVLGWQQVYSVTKRSSFSSEKLNNQNRQERLFWNGIC